jgi:hypothetical protein
MNCRPLLSGRDASCLAPPAQIRTCGFPAYGLYGASFVNGYVKPESIVV